MKTTKPHFVRTAVRTKRPQTLESSGEWWSVVVKWNRLEIQVVVATKLYRSVTAYYGYRAITDQKVGGSNPSERTTS